MNECGQTKLNFHRRLSISPPAPPSHTLTTNAGNKCVCARARRASVLSGRTHKNHARRAHHLSLTALFFLLLYCCNTRWASRTLSPEVVVTHNKQRQRRAIQSNLSFFFTLTSSKTLNGKNSQTSFVRICVREQAAQLTFSSLGRQGKIPTNWRLFRKKKQENNNNRGRGEQ